MTNGALIIRVRSEPNHPDKVDGKVISAVSRRRCLQVDSGHVCHIANAPLNQYGLRSMDSLAYLRWSMTNQYTFQRLNHDEVLRVNNWTGEHHVFGPIPKVVDGKRQHIYADGYIRRRLRHPRHRIFGVPGHEVWHGGRSDFSEATMRELWDRIMLKTGIVPTWGPFGWVTNKVQLVLPMAEPLTDQVAQQLKGTRLPWRQMVPLDLVKRIENPNDLVCLYCLGYACSLDAARREAA